MQHKRETKLADDRTSNDVRLLTRWLPVLLAIRHSSTGT